MNSWLSSLLLTASYLLLLCGEVRTLRVATAGDGSSGGYAVEVAGFFNTISRVDGSETFFMVIDEFRDDVLYGQHICAAGYGYWQPFNGKSTYKCLSTEETVVDFVPDGTFDAFRKIINYNRHNGRKGFTMGTHTFDVQLKSFKSLNYFRFNLRTKRGDMIGYWSENVAVVPEDWRCEARKKEIWCLWAPQDKDKEVINWRDYGAEYTES